MPLATCVFLRTLRLRGVASCLVLLARTVVCERMCCEAASLSDPVASDRSCPSIASGVGASTSQRMRGRADRHRVFRHPHRALLQRACPPRFWTIIPLPPDPSALSCGIGPVPLRRQARLGIVGGLIRRLALGGFVQEHATKARGQPACLAAPMCCSALEGRMVAPACSVVSATGCFAPVGPAKEIA